MIAPCVITVYTTAIGTATQRVTGWIACLSGRCGHDGLVLHRGQPAKGVLPAASVEQNGHEVTQPEARGQLWGRPQAAWQSSGSSRSSAALTRLTAVQNAHPHARSPLSVGARARTGGRGGRRTPDRVLSSARHERTPKRSSGHIVPLRQRVASLRHLLAREPWNGSSVPSRLRHRTQTSDFQRLQGLVGSPPGRRTAVPRRRTRTTFRHRRRPAHPPARMSGTISVTVSQVVRRGHSPRQRAVGIGGAAAVEAGTGEVSRRALTTGGGEGNGRGRCRHARHQEVDCQARRKPTTAVLFQLQR